MTRKERACVTGAVVGAAVGAAVAYLYATEEGTRQREGVWRAVNRLRWDVGEARQLWDELTDVWIEFQHDRSAAAHPPMAPGRRSPSGDAS
jgi:gas vesicle protein